MLTIGANVPALVPFSWSPSSLQRMTTCGYSYYQRYIAGHRSRQHAAAWFGSDIAHRIIQLAYQGTPFDEGFAQVWMAACAPICMDLHDWLELDREYRLTKGSKRSDSKEVLAWHAAHPRYHELRERIDAYQRTALGYLRWNERTSLADYYRRAAILTELPPEQILLPHPWLVEGQWLDPDIDDPDSTDEDIGVPAGVEEGTLEDEEERGGRSYRLLEGTIDGIPICGVPDVVAVHEDGMVLVGDYKTSARPLTETQLASNMQLLLYCELLYQNGIVLPEQEVLIGHIYLTETTVTQVWTDTSQLAARLPLIARQMAHAERRRAMNDFVPVAGIAASLQDPCPSCDMAHVCEAARVAPSTPASIS